MGQLAAADDALETASGLYATSLAGYRELGIQSMLAVVLRSQAQLALLAGDAAAAPDLLREALRLSSATFSVEAAAHCLSAAAALAALRGDDERAATLLGVADGLGARFGLQPEPINEHVRALVAPALARLGPVRFEQRRRAAASGVVRRIPQLEYASSVGAAAAISLERIVAELVGTL